ncbi:hypothetical protein BRAS3843_2750020 [Bradyrhizobium sp. STM 3843]|nr:hypothetical protein BRAS3843_2750020 [Bradyrhizobium sp. STM 3843]
MVPGAAIKFDDLASLSGLVGLIRFPAYAARESSRIMDCAPRAVNWRQDPCTKRLTRRTATSCVRRSALRATPTRRSRSSPAISMSCIPDISGS